MCFYIDWRKNPDQKIANEDIICYKEFSRDPSNNRRIMAKYISNFLWWDTRRKTETVYKTSKIGLPILRYTPAIEKGIHSYSCQTRCNVQGGMYRVCYIPKGATYYYNSISKEYVSDKLIVHINKIVYPYND